MDEFALIRRRLPVRVKICRRLLARGSQLVTSVRFYPKGFLGTEKAVLWLARVKSPDRWQDDGIHPRELKVWRGINQTFNGFAIDPVLREAKRDIPESEHGQMFERLCDFNDALVTLREALQAGTIVGRFIDQHGHWDHIKPYSWGGDAAIEVLLKGTGDLEDGYNRLVLISEAELQKTFMGSVAPAIPQSTAVPKPRANKARKIAATFLHLEAATIALGRYPTVRGLEEWRLRNAPTVSRDLLRKCWADETMRERLGAPAKSPERGRPLKRQR